MPDPTPGEPTLRHHPRARRDLFVIMPFSGTKSCTEEEWTDIFENVFMPAAVAADLDCSRARVSTGNLIKSIIERLHTAYIVLADITDANPNVFYELGVRHSLSKRTIIIAQGASPIPSDLRGYWSLSYGTSPGQVKKFAAELKEIVTKINEEPDKPDSPVADYLQHEFLAATRHENTEIARKLSALQTEFGGILIELERPQLNHAKNSLTDHACLSLFLDSRYLDPGPDILARMYELREILRNIAHEGLPSPLAPTAIHLLRSIDEQLRAIRASVTNGSFEQPPQLSVMEWSNSERRRNEQPTKPYCAEVRDKTFLLLSCCEPLMHSTWECPQCGTKAVVPHCSSCGINLGKH